MSKAKKSIVKTGLHVPEVSDCDVIFDSLETKSKKTASRRKRNIPRTVSVFTLNSDIDVCEIPSTSQIREKKTKNSKKSNPRKRKSIEKKSTIKSKNTQSVRASQKRTNRVNRSSDRHDLEMRLKRLNAYENYLTRGPPSKPGSKKVPEGAPGCFRGLCFIVTGVMESLEREEILDIISKYGGRSVKAVSGKVDYMIVGRDAGPAKLEKAEDLKTKMISEDQFLKLIVDLSKPLWKKIKQA